MILRVRVTMPFLAAAILFASGASHASLGEQLEAMARKGSENLHSINIMVKILEGPEIPLDVEGQGECAASTCLAYKTEEIGEEEFYLRLLSRAEVEVLAGLTVTSAGMKAYGFAALMAQGALNNAAAGALNVGGANPLDGLLTHLGANDAQDGSMAFINPLKMFEAGGFFAFAMSDMIDDTTQQVAEGMFEARAEAHRMAELAANASAARVVQFANRTVERYDVPDINETVRTPDGQTYVMRNAIVWIDPVYLLLMKHRVEGTGDDGRDFFIETINSDFRAVPGTEICEPYEITMRMGGVMDDEELAELAEAREQLDEMEAQLAAMPASQRQMVEKMMGGQMDMLRNMTDDGVMEHKQVIKDIYVNPDLAELFRINPNGGAGMAQVGPSGEGSLVERIQRDLTTLGYEPGEVTGEMTTETAVAISRYQSERGLTVSGEASEQLAAALAVEARQMAAQIASQRRAEREREVAAAAEDNICG